MGKESNRPYARDGKPYVRDAGWAGRGPLGEAALSAAMVMLALAAGFAVGFLVWAVLSLANGLVALLWDALGKRGGEGFATPWFPLVVCTLGGLVIGVWTHFPQGAPAPLETVMASFKKTGSYRVEGAGRSVVGFLLPIVFGGSVGPEAGLTGLIASACCRLRDLLKRAGLRAGAIGDATIAASVAAIFGTPLAGIVAGVESAPDEAPDPNEYELRRSAKTVLYFSAALAALGGASASSALSEALADCLVSPSRRPGRSTRFGFFLASPSGMRSPLYSRGRLRCSRVCRDVREILRSPLSQSRRWRVLSWVESLPFCPTCCFPARFKLTSLCLIGRKPARSFFWRQGSSNWRSRPCA